MMRSLFDHWDRQPKTTGTAMRGKIADGRGWISALAVAVCLVVAARLVGQATPPSAAAQPQQEVPAAATTVKGGAEVAKPQPAAMTKSDTSTDSRRKQMNDQSADLLNLAMALKAEVDKTNKDMLSLGVIRKADEIEHLARTMRQNLKQ